MYYCTTCSTYQSYSSQVWYIWFYYYVECINELCSGMYEVAATFDCLITISKRLACCKKQISFYLTSVTMFVFAASYYIFFLFNFAIVKKKAQLGSYFDASLNQTVNQTREFFVYEYTEFSYTDLNSSFKIAHGLMRDGVLLILSVMLNILLMFKLKKIMKKKIRISTVSLDGSKLTSRQSSTLINARRAHKNMAIMMIVSGLNYLIGHAPSFIKYCFMVTPSQFRSCFTLVSLVLFYSSYATPFFIYVTFNKMFRSHIFK